MKKITLVAAIAALPFANASYAQAQAAIGEPGLYAFYHPGGDLLRAGSDRYDGLRNAQASALPARPSRVHRHSAKPVSR